MLSLLRPVWAYRGFVLSSVKREFKSKYLNSALGICWVVLQPLSMILVYTLIFSNVMQARLPGIDNTFAYSIYLCAGVLTWGLFTEITGRSVNIFLENANLLKKISFPKLCLPVIAISSALVNFTIIFGLFCIFLAVTGNFPGWVMLWILPLLGIQIMFSIGLGIVLGVANVFFRDVGQAFNVILQFWFWLTPIVYPASILNDTLKALLQFNPMAGLISSYQNLLLLGQPPEWQPLLPITLLGALLCTWGLFSFKRHGGELVDEL